MQFKETRFIKNTLQDFQEDIFGTDIQKKLQLQIIMQIEIDTNKFFEVISPHQPVAIASNAKYSSIQYDLFEGAGGYLYYYLKFYDFLEKFDPQQFSQQNHKYYKVIIQTHKQYKYEIELLYGLTGFLWCLLDLQIQFQYNDDVNPAFKIEIENYVIDIMKIILNKGIQDFKNKKQQNKKERLYYSFCGVEYLGAAHGTLGIIYMLLKGYQINQQLIDNNDAQFSKVLKEKIKESVDFILEFQNEEGNFPPFSKFQAQNENSLVQFCHGAPGAISALLECFKVYQKKEYLQAALKSGECIWKYGIIKKGFGLCHGIEGNSYGFLSLYRQTQNKKWLYYAYQFCLLKQNKQVLEQIKNYAFQDRYEVGVPDFPYSLMSGLSGSLCYQIDTLNPLKSKFPIFEI